MNSYKRLLNNSIVFSIGNFISKFSTLLMLPFYTHLLTSEEFGQIDLIVTTLTLLVPFLTINIVEAVVRFSLDKKNNSYGQVMTNSTVFILFGLVILLTAYPLLIKLNFISEYVGLFYVLFLMIAIRTSIKQFARSINLIKEYMVSDILYSFVFILANVIFLYIVKIGVEGYLISMILAYLIDMIFLTIKTECYKYIRFKHLDTLRIKSMFYYSLPLMPNSVMWWIMGISDRYLITYYTGLSAVGIYAAANRFPSIITYFYGFFYKAWQLSAIEEYESSDKEKFFTNVFSIIFFMLVIFASIFLMFNKLIIDLFVSKDFYEAWKYTPFLLMGAIFSSFSGFLGTNYQASMNTKGVLYSSLIGALVNLILNIILIPNFGIFGASIATMISFFTMWMIRVFDTRKFIKINYPKYKMIMVLLILFIQIFIGFLSIKIVIYYLINCLMFVIIILSSFEIIRVPLLTIYNKIFASFRNKKS